MISGMAVLQVYNQIYNTTVAGNGGATALNYTSPVLHTVVLSNLKPGTRYFYQVGDGTTYSGTFNFTALAAPSESPSVALQTHDRFGICFDVTLSAAHQKQRKHPAAPQQYW